MAIEYKRRYEFAERGATCQICWKRMFVATEYGRLGICGRCAEIAANLFWLAGSGDYLTWDDDRIDETYRKKPIPEGLRWQVFKRDKFTCVKCGAQKYLRADHIHPERHGGAATLENLQTLCRSCNSKKGSKVD